MSETIRVYTPPTVGSFDPYTVGISGDIPAFFGYRQGGGGGGVIAAEVTTTAGGGDGGDIRLPPLTFVPNPPGVRTLAGGPPGGTYVASPDGPPARPGTGNLIQDLQNIGQIPGLGMTMLSLLSGPAAIPGIMAGTALSSLSSDPRVTGLAGGLGDLLSDLGRTPEERAMRSEASKGFDKEAQRAAETRMGITVEDLPALENIAALNNLPGAFIDIEVAPGVVQTIEAPPMSMQTVSPAAVSDVFGVEAPALSLSELSNIAQVAEPQAPTTMAVPGPEADIGVFGEENDTTTGTPSQPGAPAAPSAPSAPAAPAAPTGALASLQANFADLMTALDRQEMEARALDDARTAMINAVNIAAALSSDKGLGDIDGSVPSADKSEPGIGGEKGEPGIGDFGAPDGLGEGWGDTVGIGDVADAQAAANEAAQADANAAAANADADASPGGATSGDAPGDGGDGGDGGYYQGGMVRFAEGGLVPLAGGGKIAIGPGGGLDDLIPTSINGRRAAALSDGEFVIPADVVSMMGDGSSNAGARRLYDLVRQIRDAKTGTTKQAGPLPVGEILKRSMGR